MKVEIEANINSESELDPEQQAIMLEALRLAALPKPETHSDLTINQNEQNKTN